MARLDDASERKLRLFCCASVRRVLGTDSLSDLYERAIECAERFADGSATESELHEHYQAVDESQSATVSYEQRMLVHAVRWTVGREMNGSSICYSVVAAAERSVPRSEYEAESLAQLHLVRDIFYLSAHEVELPGEEDEAVRLLAREIYESGDFLRVPELAETLTAGGFPEAMVEHCLDGAPHVRGCWVVDLLLDYE